jgi:hypothetical protein
MKNKKIQLNQRKKLTYVTQMNLDIVQDKLSIVGKIYFQLSIQRNK